MKPETLSTEDQALSTRSAIVKWGGYGVAFASACFVISYFAFIIGLIWKGNPWISDMVREHTAAMIGLPLAVVAALLVVAILQVVAVGQIEFEVGWVKFRGASGPVVLWVLCFCAMVGGIKWLW